MKITFKRQTDHTDVGGAIIKRWYVESDGKPAKNGIGNQLIISGSGDDVWYHNYLEPYFDDEYPTFAQVKSAVIAQLESNNKQQGDKNV